MKPNIQLITAAVLSIGGLVLLFCGAFIAPQGEIHESLLVGFGEVATFAGALFGIDYTYRFRNQSKIPKNDPKIIEEEQKHREHHFRDINKKKKRKIRNQQLRNVT